MKLTQVAQPIRQVSRTPIGWAMAFTFTIVVHTFLAANSYASEATTDTNSVNVIGYAWPNKDVLIPVSSETKFRWLRRGQEYLIIGKIDTGYLMLIETKDGRLQPALVPFRDRMGNSTEYGNYAGIEEAAKPGYFPLKAGDKFPVLARGEGKYTIRYAMQGCDDAIPVAEADVKFLSVSEINKEIELVIGDLKAKGDRQLANGDYDNARIGAIFSEYKGNYAEDTVKIRKELAGQYQIKAMQALSEQRKKFEDAQRAKGLVESDGEWITPQEVERRKEAAKAEEVRQQKIEEESRAASEKYKLERKKYLETINVLYATCPKCGHGTIMRKCPNCGAEGRFKRINDVQIECEKCGLLFSSATCNNCGASISASQSTGSMFISHPSD